MIYVYRLGLDKWVLLCILFVGGVLLAMEQYPGGFDPNILPATSAGIPLQQSEAEFPCRITSYNVCYTKLLRVRFMSF